MKNVKAELWQVTICEGALAMVHGCNEPLKEYYIPECNISFNIYQDNLNVFIPSEDRYSGGEYNKPVLLEKVEIAENLAKSLKQYVELKKSLYNEVTRMMTEIEMKKT